MSTSIRRPHFDAEVDAFAFRDLFFGCYERWEIAGSVRRKKSEVGDVEHVVIPKRNFRGESLLWHRIEKLTRDPNDMFADPDAPLSKHQYPPNGSPRWGEKYRGVDFRGFAHEIFCAESANWGSVLTIRTGPAAFSEMLVTRLKQSGKLRQQDGYVRYPDGSIFATPDEANYFKVCGVPFCAPADRRAE